MNIESIYFDIFLSCGMIHLVLTAVMSLFARHQVKYLSIAWIMGIFAFALLSVSYYASTQKAHPGILHPAMLIALVAISYLQSIYPLSIPMPGYLQWGRMWRYAAPALVFIGFYVLGILVGDRPLVINGLKDIRDNIFSSDLLLRIGMLLTSFYYIANIFLLPRRLTQVSYPHYLVGYSTLLGLSAIFYLFIALNYKPYLMMVYAIIFTGLNAYLCLRTLETTALELPKPVVKEVKKAPTDEDLRKSEMDFNEANLQRFQRVEYWMQNNVDVWTNSDFNRDALCREAGINRHLVLQSLRSQGYNNIRDYISAYRIHELQRRIREGRVTTVADGQDVGFGTLKTLRSTFLKFVGVTIDQYLQENTPTKE